VNAPTYLIGDATKPTGAGEKIIAHVCNDAGAWGAGFVLALSARWREPERVYRNWAMQEAANGGRLQLGAVKFAVVDSALTVANIIGQHGTGYADGVPPIRYDALRTGLECVCRNALALNASVHAPRLGCGLAGGEWSEVEKIITETLCEKGVAVFIYDLPRHEGGAK
jgi:O-acetyl-ADP-ribose deacetylase (regulator of RNase III)